MDLEHERIYNDIFSDINYLLHVVVISFTVLKNVKYYILIN